MQVYCTNLLKLLAWFTLDKKSHPNTKLDSKKSILLLKTTKKYLIKKWAKGVHSLNMHHHNL